MQFCIATSFTQKQIDLKILMGKTKTEVFGHLKNWGIKVAPTKTEGYYSGYNNGLQFSFKNDTLKTMWVLYTTREGDVFPYQVDKILKADSDINAAIKAYGKPNETGMGYSANNQTGWVKWHLPAYQLHCEVKYSKVKMVTLMEPKWSAGKR
ncbi:MAG: hypothetical protein K0S32_3012 [Bacteroidetes bacterium]|nr:hypothetical protein [Bacteroidota bacterium]